MKFNIRSGKQIKLKDLQVGDTFISGLDNQYKVMEIEDSILYCYMFVSRDAIDFHINDDVMIKRAYRGGELLIHDVTEDCFDIVDSLHELKFGQIFKYTPEFDKLQLYLGYNKEVQRHISIDLQTGKQCMWDGNWSEYYVLKNDGSVDVTIESWEE